MYTRCVLIPGVVVYSYSHQLHCFQIPVYYLRAGLVYTVCEPCASVLALWLRRPRSNCLYERCKMIYLLYIE
jgi:hypothetical protein